MLLEDEDSVLLFLMLSTLNIVLRYMVGLQTDLSMLSNFCILLEILSSFLYLHALPLTFHAVLYNDYLKKLLAYHIICLIYDEPLG